MNTWKRKALALARLAEDQAGKPEGELAREKLLKILERHPEARDYEPLQAFMVKDLVRMGRMGVSREGSWTGRDMNEAISKMVADYRQRLKDAEARTLYLKLLPEVKQITHAKDIQDIGKAMSIGLAVGLAVGLSEAAS